MKSTEQLLKRIYENTDDSVCYSTLPTKENGDIDLAKAYGGLGWVTDEMVYAQYGRFCSELDRVEKLCQKLRQKERMWLLMEEQNKKIPSYCRGTNDYPPLSKREKEFMDKHNPRRNRAIKPPLNARKYTLWLQFRKDLPLKKETYRLIFGCTEEVAQYCVDKVIAVNKIKPNH